MTIKRYHVKAIDHRVDDDDILLYEEICPKHRLADTIEEAYEYVENMDKGGDGVTVGIVGVLKVTVEIVLIKRKK